MSTNRGFAVAFVCLIVMALVLAAPVAAFDSRSYDSIIIGAGEVINDDLILFGNDVVVNGTVNGDLLVFANNVTVNGPVNGSVLLVARFATLNSALSGSLYGGAAALTLGSKAAIGRNVYYGAYTIESAAGSRVKRDLVLGAYQVVLNGELGGNANVASAALELNGAVAGDLNAAVGDPSSQGMRYWSPSQYMQDLPSPLQPGLRVSSNAHVGGKLTYTSRAEQAAGIAIRPEGGVVFHLEQPAQQPQPQVDVRVDFGRWLWNQFVGRVRELLTLVILGALALWKLPGTLKAVAKSVRARPLPALGWGLVVILVASVGAIVVGLAILALALLLALLTLGGLAGPVLGIGMSALGLGFSLCSLLVTYGSKLAVAYCIGMLLVRQLLPANADDKRLILVLGLLIYLLIRAVPVVGGLFGAIVTLIGVGAMWLAYQQQRQVA